VKKGGSALDGPFFNLPAKRDTSLHGCRMKGVHMPDKATHTYLFKAGSWRADGEYFDADGGKYPVAGVSRITHRNALWYNESEMKIFGSRDIAFSSYYEIVPFLDSRDVTCWTSENDALGKLIGQFVLVGDVILSIYRSENAPYTGTECLLRVSDTAYRNWGTLFCGADKLSSWMMSLNRE
jgi:hypothetical protein